ncbi:MAG: NAD(P)H-hydrate epimerase [Candidatus Omnitrophota bacterium]
MVRNFKLLTARQAKDIDFKARNIFGISTLVLMENAGRAVAEEAVKILRHQRAAAIFCGKGNNGGDGFVAARHLLAYGIRPDIFLAGSISEVGNEAGINLEILLKLNQKIIEVKKDNLTRIKNRISKRVLIIDALLGVGLKGDVRGVFRDLIEIINSSEAKILSVDIPSGLDATTGRILGCCVKADKTVSFTARKRGMVFGDGPRYCGRVIVKDLGIPLKDEK